MGSLPGFSTTAQHTVGTPIIQASLRPREPRSSSSCVGFPRTQRWGIPCFPSVGPGFPCGADWAALMLGHCAGFYEQTWRRRLLSPVREGVNPACARKGCCECWEVPWGLGSVLGFPLDSLVHVLQTIPSLAGCVGVEGCGEGRKGEAQLGRELIMS